MVPPRFCDSDYHLFVVITLAAVGDKDYGNGRGVQINSKYQNAAYICLMGTNTQHSGHMGKKNQNELMAEIYSKCPVRTIGKVLLMKVS